LTADRLSRRDFGRLTGLTGAAVALPRRASASERGWRVTGRGLPGLGDFDAAVMGFMEDRAITCGSLAVTRNGRLVLARGYTWSAGPVPVTWPTSLFRTASVTKPVTGWNPRPRHVGGPASRGRHRPPAAPAPRWLEP
jgi:CubicO group peptidase (beta-lactamase class C family)